jgi:hypothetical protein
MKIKTMVNQSKRITNPKKWSRWSVEGDGEELSEDMKSTGEYKNGLMNSTTKINTNKLNIYTNDRKRLVMKRKKDE